MCAMDNESINQAWDLLFKMLSLEINGKYNSMKEFQQEPRDFLLTLVPDTSLKVIQHVASKEIEEKIVGEFFSETAGEFANKLTMIKELVAIVEKICPELKSTTQELLTLLNDGISESEMEDLNNNHRLLKCVQNFYCSAIKSLPLPSEASSNCEAAEDASIQDAVLERLKKEVLPDEAPKILKIVENNDLPTEIMTAPFVEDFSFNESASNIKKKYKCKFCSRVFLNNLLFQHHIRNMHSKLRKSLVCELCHRAFIFRAELECHREKHFTESCIHFCEVCDKGFESSWSLRKHMFYHKSVDSCNEVNTGKHICKFCEKELSSELHKENHENRHLFEQYLLVDDSEFRQDRVASPECQGTEMAASESYVMSFDLSLCFNTRTKRLQRLADVVKPCSILLTDIVNLKDEHGKYSYILKECHVCLFDIGKIKKDDV